MIKIFILIENSISFILTNKKYIMPILKLHPKISNYYQLNSKLFPKFHSK